jgi:hypothetical protein
MLRVFVQIDASRCEEQPLRARTKPHGEVSPKVQFPNRALQALLVVAFLLIVLLVTVSSRYTVYVKRSVAYRLDRWTGQVVDVDSLNISKPQPTQFRKLHSWDTFVISGTGTQITVSTKWIEGEAWYHVVLSAKGGPIRIEKDPKNPKGVQISSLPIPQTALNDSENRYEYSIDLKDADDFTLGTIEVPASSMTPIVDTAGGPTIDLDTYGKYPIKLATYDAISAVEVRSTAFNTKP